MTYLSRRLHSKLFALAFVAALIGTTHQAAGGAEECPALFARDNLVAWCIVPFDSRRRTPEERAEMLQRLGFRRFAYDWRAEHLPTLERELKALNERHISLDAVWFPAALDKDARTILDALRRHAIHTQLWITMGDPAADRGGEAKLAAAVAAIKPIAEEADKIGCEVALYNHGGWFGEPENQLAIIEKLRMSNVGIVYNLHHGHDHLDRFPTLLKKMLPHLLALNLNGMAREGDRLGKKILPLGQGEVDLPLLRTICASGYRGPIGILGHTQDDAEARLRDNLDGLDWLTPQLGGAAAGPPPVPRTPVGEGPPAPAGQFAGRVAAGQPDFRQPPLTIECRLKLQSRDNYNILVASDTKASGAHWELFTMAGSGLLTAYLPGMKPDHVRSQQNICDAAWHDVAMIYEARRVRLLLDGQVVADEPTEQAASATVPGGLGLGRLVEGGLGCQGELAYVRLSRGVRAPVHQGTVPPAADEATIGLWRFDEHRGDVPDQSRLKNTAKLAASAPTEQGPVPPSGVHCQPADEELTALLVDRSARDVYLGVKVDSEGRVFVGAREAVYLFESDRTGAFKLREEICRLPADSIVMGLELRGDDLYVLADNALYLLPGGRIEPGVRPKRILWGLPLDLHVSFHCLAWGPEGDLYLTHGDPLLNYGDWNRPDHWGHWTLYAGLEGTKVPYTGVGAVLRVRPDGSFVEVVAGGLRGPVGLAFDPHWNLFTNDNDHESRADLYAPARLLHVTPHIDFAWPRGWMASKSPMRFDLVEPLTADLGRGVPCDLAWYEQATEHGQQGSLLMARWDQTTVNRYPLEPRGASFATQERPFLNGSDFARPVGAAIGPDGRLFVTCLYLGGNVGSPHCYSDLMMVCNEKTDGVNRSSTYDIARAPDDKLWQELSEPLWQRRWRAHQEILRRGGKLLDEAVERLATLDDGDAEFHLPWLAAASGSAGARRLLIDLAGDRRGDIRLQAVRVLAESPQLNPPDELFIAALDDTEPAVQLAALGALFSRRRGLPVEKIARLAASDDPYLRQTAAKLLARRADDDDLARLARHEEGAMRRAAGLAAGFRLTVPPDDFVPPENLPLSYNSGNAAFTLQFADADQPVDLRAIGRVGSFTTAQWWKAAATTGDHRQMFELLLSMLDDADDQVVQQASYFLSLLDDPHAEPRIADARRRVLARQAARFAPRTIDRMWSLGPIADRSFLLEKVAPPDRGPVDLAASYVTSSGKLAWRQAESPAGRIPAVKLTDAEATTRTYFSFQLQSIARQAAVVEIEGGGLPFFWHNGQPVIAAERSAALELQPGGNDVLVRIDRRAGDEATLRFRAGDGAIATLPEKVDFTSLAERLKQAAKGADQVPAELLAADWSDAANGGDAQQGRKLFGSLGCSKCHGVTIEQPGGGAPNLAEVRRRFTTAYLVESILLPSKQVADPFRGATLALADGRTLRGLVVADTDQQLEVLLPDATRMRIAKSEIEERSPSEVSPMPSGLIKTQQELRDLLAYLLSDRPTPP